MLLPVHCVLYCVLINVALNMELELDLVDAWPWIFTILVGLIAAVLIKTKWSSRNEPPGPWGLPVLGYLPFLGRKMNLTVNNLYKKYGEVFQLKMGSRKLL